MPRFFLTALLALLMGLACLLACLTPFCRSLEENIGLAFLFNNRGIRNPPPEVVIVAIDQESAKALDLYKRAEKWPRSLHAKLVKKLAEKNPAVIVFDVLFDQPRSQKQDSRFAEAIRNASNVVLCEYIRSEKIHLSNEREGGSEVDIQRFVSPIPLLAEAAAATAPFPLPKIPLRISQYWTFKTEAGDKPTLPVVAFQLYALRAYEEFIKIIGEISPPLVEALPRDKQEILRERSVETLIRELRSRLAEDPPLAAGILHELDEPAWEAMGSRTINILKSLIKMYLAEDTQYLNFYGPPGTVTTLHYHQMIGDAAGPGEIQNDYDLTGKAVFVGLSELSNPEQRDHYNIAFSRPDGVEASGVEIAATAFGNLLDGTSVRPVARTVHAIVTILWAFSLFVLCSLLPAAVSAVLVVGASLAYVGVVQHCFSLDGTWYPVVIPLAESLVAFFGAVLWRYTEAHRRQKRIHEAFRHYLPKTVVDQLVRNVREIQGDSQIVEGTCLFADAANYTTLSERMDPRGLTEFMNSYFEAVFLPVKQCGGTISEIIGDSILAIWANPQLDISLRRNACTAALDISKAVRRFNQLSDLRLPLRIGLHSGEISMGTLGAGDHFEYRPVGDVVNTASRIEGLNKYLHTEILISSEVLENIQGFCTREVGAFVFVGKSKPVTIHELLCHMEDCGCEREELCIWFTRGLQAYREQSWHEAIRLFQGLLRNFGSDGPSTFYLNLCRQHRDDPPRGTWDGSITMARK